MAKPQIRIRSAAPSDVTAIVDIHFNAFSQGPMTRTLHPGGVSAEARFKFGNGLFPSTQRDPVAAGEAIIMVAELVPPAKEAALAAEVTAAPGVESHVIAFAKWTIHRQPRREDQWNVKEVFTAEELGEGADVEVFDAFLGGLHRMRRRWMRGDPGIELNILACAPTYFRLGAGSGLLHWGTALADQEGLIAWLEASPLGFRLYERFGFEAVEVQDLAITERWKTTPREGEDWGTASAIESFGPLAPGWFRTVMMRRSPKPPMI